ncbi:MAG: TolC family protein [Cyanobacteria bacterium SZAS-4]|nr:TolC family protein [Cyanobacteria bacterium SZAS-4]
MRWSCYAIAAAVIHATLIPADAELVPATAELPPTLRPALAASVEQVSLPQSFNLGLANNPRTAAARAQLGVTKSNLAQANVLPNPGIYIDNQYQFTYKLGASMLVEPPWRIIFRRAAAKKQITQTDLEITRTLWLFRGEVRRTFVEALIAREMADLRRQLLTIMRRLLSIAKERFEKGDVPKLDVHRAELAVIQAEIQVEQADILVTQTREQLNVVLARDKNLVEPAPLSSVLADLVKESTRLGDSQQLVHAAMTNRLEIKIVEQQIKVNDANLTVARGNILPAPRFTVGRMTEDRINSDKNRKSAFFQALIEMPILDRQQGFIARGKAVDKQLNLEVLSQQNIITQQVLLAYRRVQSALARIDRYQHQALPISITISSAADLSYRMGQTDINSALVAQQDNILVRTQYLDSLLAYELAMNDLEQAIGIPL